MHKSINKVKHDAYTFYEHIKLNKIGEREIQTRDFVVVRSHLRDIRLLFKARGTSSFENLLISSLWPKEKKRRTRASLSGPFYQIVAL